MSKSNYEKIASALFYSEQGQKYEVEGNYEAAIKAYAESIRIFPFKENLGSYYNLGSCYYKSQDYRRAIDNYTQALQINPDYLDAYYNRGTSRSRLEDYKGAIEDYTQVISRTPDDANAYELRGGCYFKSGNIQEAMSDFKRAAKIYLSQGNLPRYQRIMALPGMASPSNSSSNSSSTEKGCFIATAAYSGSRCNAVHSNKPQNLSDCLLTNSTVPHNSGNRCILLPHTQTSTHSVISVTKNF